MAKNRIRFGSDVVLIDSKIGIGTATPQSKLDVAGNVNISGIVTSYIFSGTLQGYASTAGIATYASTAGIATYASTAGIATYATSSGIATYATSSGIATYASTAGIATSLETQRIFEITGDIIAAPIFFDGTGNVSLAATIQPNSVGLGTDTTGEYVQTVSGTLNQIDVSGGTGEGSTPTISIASNPILPGNVTIANDLQVNNNLNVTGNITIGGTSAYIVANDFRVKDADIVTGFTTNSSGDDVSNDTTANHGGIAIASTEGNPLIQLYNVAIGETNPATYKKIMWFKSGSFIGLNTDAWLINYAVGIGSTQFPSGTRLAVGSVQFTESDLSVVRNINASGIVTADTFRPSSGYIQAADGTNSLYIYSGTGNVAFQGTIGASQVNNASGYKVIGFAGTDITFENNAYISGITTSLGGFVGNLEGNATSSEYAITAGISTVSQGLIGTPDIIVGIITASNFIGNLSGTATTATNLSDASNITTGIISSSRLSGTYNINISGDSTYATTAGIATYATVSGISTNVIGGIGSITSLSVSGVSTVGFLTGTDAFYSGIVTATNFNGSGVNLTDVVNSIVAGTNVSISSSTGQVTISATGSVGGGSSISISTTTSSDYQFITLVSSASTTILGISSISNPLVYVPSTGKLGVGTTTPTSTLHVVGDALVTGILTANRIISSVYGEFTGGSISGSNIVGTSLSISGISTLGTLQISSGIVTSTSGVVTYYGDGRNLTITNLGVGIATEGGTVGTGVTLIDLRGSGISTITVSSGIATINITGGQTTTTSDISPVVMGMIF